MKSAYKLAAALPLLGLLAPALYVRSETPAAAAAPLEEQPAAPPTIKYPSHIDAGHSAPPAGALSNPYKGDQDTAAAGVGLFASMNCDGCHGGGASGFAAPSLADGRWRYGDSEEEIFQSIYYGRPKGMPAFGGVLGGDGIWILVTYLKSLPVPDNKTQSWETQALAPSIVPVAAIAAEPAAAPAVAGAEGLLKKYVCIACHQADAKTVGPAYKEVAAKYRGSEDAEEMLFDKVKNGGVGVWGQVPMPPNATVPDAELHAMITWILAVN
jgi:cytochrome c551/c552